MTAHPEIVDREAWQSARDALLTEEKAATRQQDAVAARRRRLPMTPFGTDYTFQTADGSRSLLDLFDGRDQLAVYQFMDLGPDSFCPGCTWFTDNVPPTAPRLLADNGITWWTVSDMPLEQLQGYAAERGWSLPFASSRGTTFSADCDTGPGFMLTVFLRDGEEVYRTYNTTSRGVDRILFVNNLQDLSVYGRQEEWEDSPPGWPQGPTDG